MKYRGVFVGATQLALGLSFLFITSCSESPDQAELNAWVDDVADGKLIRDIESIESRAGDQDIEKDLLGGGTFVDPGISIAKYPEVEPLSLEGVLGFDDPAQDPCPNVPKPKAGAPSYMMEQALSELNACFRGFMMTDSVHYLAIQLFKRFHLPEGTPPLSEMSFKELADFVTSQPLEMTLERLLKEEDRSRLRNSYSDLDLQELRKLVLMRRENLRDVEHVSFVAMDLRKDLLVYGSTRTNRYAALIALRLTHGDEEGKNTARKLKEALKWHFGTPADVESFPTELLHPYSMVGLVARPGQELAPLHPLYENPFQIVLFQRENFEGSDAHIDSIVERYRELRDLDNPPLPADGVTPSSDAVRVAFIDSGIDYVGIPDMGKFLSDNRPGRLQSLDLPDGDNNPWLPSLGVMGHGTFTVATLLTVLAHHSPEVLKERKLDLAMWKVYSLRRILSGSSERGRNWNSRPLPLHETLVDRQTQTENPNHVQADIVSVSMSFQAFPIFQAVSDMNLLKRGDSLWVMSAGNDGQPVEISKMGCFSDVPKQHRPREKILCVGALKKGIVTDEIASYSNFGDLVDVYSYESFTGLCPGGTSCSAPAITAAATILKARFPSLGASEIREVILEASEWKTLKVEKRPNSLHPPAGPSELKVRVFDPTSNAMGRALKIASSKKLL